MTRLNMRNDALQNPSLRFSCGTWSAHSSSGTAQVHYEYHASGSSSVVRTWGILGVRLPRRGSEQRLRLKGLDVVRGDDRCVGAHRQAGMGEERSERAGTWRGAGMGSAGATSAVRIAQERVGITSAAWRENAGFVGVRWRKRCARRRERRARRRLTSPTGRTEYWASGDINSGGKGPQCIIHQDPGISRG